MRKAFVRIIVAAIVALTIAPSVDGHSYAECMHMGGTYTYGVCANVDY